MPSLRDQFKPQTLVTSYDETMSPHKILEKFTKEFPRMEELIRKHNTVEGLNDKELAEFRDFQDVWYMMDFDASRVINSPEGQESSLILQQADSIPLAIWRWHFDRRPVKLFVSFETLAFTFTGIGMQGASIWFSELIGVYDFRNPILRGQRAIMAERWPFLVRLQKEINEVMLPEGGVDVEWLQCQVESFKERCGDTFQVDLSWPPGVY